MYTSYIGKKFLRIYKEKEKKPENYTAKEFFDEVLFPVFFDDEKHLMHVHGSTFFQSVGKNDLKTGESESYFRLNRLHQDIANNRISGSTYVGYAAGKIDQPTSGQVSSIGHNIESEEVYASWVGEGLSIGFSGGLILIDNEEIMWNLFKGWILYRKYINQTPNIKGRQIETWNGHWLAHCFSKDFNKEHPLTFFELPIGTSGEEKGTISIATLNWAKIIFALSRKFPNTVITSHAYFLGKTNTTFGFINLYLPDVRRMFELRDKLFLDKEKMVLSDKEIETLEPFYRFNEACKMGTIGLKSIEPRGLREFMSKGTVDYTQGKDYKFTDERSLINFQLYKLWIIAMLNKTELLKLATDVSRALLAHESHDPKENRGKSEKSNQVKGILDSKNLKNFIDGLTELVIKENADIFKEVVEQTLKMPSDNFPLFSTLIRFEYAFLKTK
ncbi:hypothetical protein LV84_03741 [Algoriphagus ratkowskyi]|uniref:Uncharacterized protein n=1 Tax=Algoriphagus ratkowskyi TaxID=57028 RepID=A0A2W7QTL2_9BACT|nr:hypothetical protein [Algoriphagus ratkowskyi]PZX51584.1 hypothetical protein LV84_03741 [Algoriphagus ratkowskyi]TXD78858.1 hypothetical protein ESW18_04885 [Algoriphagus ratkowskyi]